MSAHVFREYDIRGHAERDLDDGFVERVGRALAEFLRPDGVARPPRVAVGRDCRLSGPRLFGALTAGLVAGGAEVLDVGVGPTPKLYFAVHQLGADGGVMITASHNAAEDNGMKIMRGRDPFFGTALEELREVVLGPALPRVPGGSIRARSVDDGYVARVVEGMTPNAGTLGVVVDAGNGAAGPLGLRALNALGYRPVALFSEMDGRFPHHDPDPTVAKNLSHLIERVRAEQAHVGLAWDGDGDRLGVVDRTGEIVWGDRLLALFARDVLARSPGAAVIGDVKCSQSLFDEVTRRGGRAIMWKTGHSAIKTKMKAEGAALAGEMSGHFFFADRYFGYDDGIYAALRLLEILHRRGHSVLEELGDVPPSFHTPEIRVDCPDALKFEVVRRVLERLEPSGRVNTLDGVRVTYEDGAWSLVRASNTGPLIVLRFEAPSAERLAAIRSEVEAVVRVARAESGAS
ncbi:MAG TPA: phosphomannomutase/phosphoglucomutase [Polyangiaceae bacterium]|nr:phosphomannomutase/phosphoglucomutase [Polyangiaceae bacterium]